MNGFVPAQTASDPDAVVVHAGFPNPAADTSLGALDLHQLLVRRPVSTFFFRIEGAAWQPLGIFNGDLAIIDRGLDPRPGDTVAWWDSEDGAFSLSFYRNMPPGAAVWGVVTSTVHELRKVHV